MSVSDRHFQAGEGDRPEDQRARSLQDLFRAMAAISSVESVPELLPHLARMIADSVGSPRCSIFLYDAELTRVTAHFFWEDPATGQPGDPVFDPGQGAPETPTVRRVIRSCSVLERLPGEVDDALLPADDWPREAGWRGDLAVPLVWNERVEGVAFIDLPAELDRFSRLQREVVLGVAQQAAGAVSHLRTLAAEKEARAQTEMLLELSRVFNQADSTADIYDALAEAIRSVVSTDAVSIVVQDHNRMPAQQPSIRRVVALGLTVDEIRVRDEILSQRTTLGSTIDRTADLQRNPVIIDLRSSAVDNPTLRATFEQSGVAELLAAPIIVSGTLHGMLYSWSRLADARLDPELLPIVGTMTWHAARAVERLMLIDLERQQRRRAEALTEINRALTGADDTSALLQVAVSSVRTLLRADLASLAVETSNGSSAIYTSGATEDELRMLLSGTPPKADVESIQPIDDLTALFDDPHAEFAAYLIGGGARHAVAVPVVHREERIGVIHAWFRSEDADYCTEDLATLERVLVELSAGLDRVALQASERRERTRAETLLAFSRVLNRSTDIPVVRTAITEMVNGLFPDARVSLLVSGDPSGNGEPDPILPEEFGERLTALLESASDGQVAQTVEIDGESIFAVPLMSDAEVLGAVIVACDEGQPLSDDDRTLLASLAPQAAAALRRARLFEVAERHIGELTLLQEVGRTIAARQRLPEISEYIFSEVRKLIDYSVGIVALEGNNAGYLEIASVWGDLVPGQAEPRVPIDESLMGAVYRSHKPVMVDDVAAHPGAWLKARAVWRSLLCVPLMAGNRAIGTLMLGHSTAGAFTEEDVRLATLLAGQAGAAIYQARESERQRELYRAGVEALAAAVDAKDSYIHSHSRLVADLSRRTALELGLSGEDVERIELAGLLHDVGKIGIPEHILTKPGRLDPQERLIMIGHAALGARIVAAHPSLVEVAKLVLHHHEWHNGSGYPDGLRGDEVPLGSAIIAVADAFDSMTSYRPYRKPLAYEAAREELRRWSGTQFHPRVVEAFLKVIEGEHPVGQAGLADPAMKLEPIQALDVIAPRILSQIATEISHLTDLYPFLDRVQQIICREMKYDDVHILLYDEAEDQLVLAASTVQSNLAGRYRIQSGEGLTGIAFETGLVVNSGDVTEDPRARPTDLAARSLLAVPLLVDDEVIGVLGSGSAEPERYDDRDVTLMIAIAGQIAPTIRVAQLHDHAKRAATTDGLTGVMNHRAFYQRLEEMIGGLEGWDDGLHLLIIDVIGLKAVNDVHGHLAGDRALQAVANALKHRVREEDEIARYGGDEFVVIVHGTPRAGLGALVDRIAAPVEFTLEDGRTLTVRLRSGVASAHSAMERATELVARADAELYREISPTVRPDE